MADPLSRRTRALIAATIIPVIIIVDQWTKWLVLNTPQFNALGCLDRTERCGRIELSPIVDLSMVWNRGMSFGAFQSEGVMRWVLFAVTVAIATGFFIWLLRAERRLTAISLAIVVAGAVGNMIDRARFGAVVDFIDFSDIWFVYVFNVADSAVTIGAALLFLDQFLISRAPKPSGADVSAGLNNKP
ncbi:MAG: signal peptidase II [Pseudomonadota bacterium]